MSIATENLGRFLEPFVSCFSREVAQKVVDFRADGAMQERIDYLADRANDGLLTVDERDEYAGYLHAIDMIAVLQAKARAYLSDSC